MASQTPGFPSWSKEPRDRKPSSRDVAIQPDLEPDHGSDQGSDQGKTFQNSRLKIPN